MGWANIAAAIAGLMFGIGLAVSGMVDPARILGFLDFAAIATGGWDPTLALVMAGALGVAMPAFALARRRQAPTGAPAFQEPPATGIDAKLLSGAALFGIGWGLVGYCPGAALAAFGFGQPATLAFVVAMVIGMAVHCAASARR